MSMTQVLGHGARRQAVAQALEGKEGELLVVLADDYTAAGEELEQVVDLAGRDVVNLTSGTSEEARALAAQVAARGAHYLDGALMAHPEHVGRPETVLVYSGSTEAYQRQEALLRSLGSATYLGDDAGTAALYDAAMLNFAWATLVGFLHTAALLTDAGVAMRSVAPVLTGWMATTVSDVIDDYAGQVDQRQYPGDEEWLELDFPLMDHVIAATAERGLDTRLPQLVRDLTAEGIAAGHGSDSFASLIEVIRQPGANI